MRRYFIFISLLLLGFHSCKKAEMTSPAFDENLRIKMIETVDSTKRTLLLNCFTEKIYGCSNNSIESTYVIAGDKITINFIRIVFPAICLTSLGPASTSIKLEGLVNKVYELELNFGTRKVSGQLHVSAGNFTAELPIQTKVQFINPALGRIPDNTLYGTVHYHFASTAPTVQKFIDSLQSYGATQTLLPQGDYGSFQIEPNGQIRQTQDLGYYFTRYYIFSYPGNSGPFKNLVKRYGANYPDSLLVTLNTIRGETFYSWIR